MSILLASWIAAQTWAWDPTPTATAYRIYYQAGTPNAWCSQQYFEFSAASICTPTLEPTVCEADIGEPAGDPVFFNITALNAWGESTWDHGSKVTCP